MGCNGIEADATERARVVNSFGGASVGLDTGYVVVGGDFLSITG
jgi:hypothetical protein